MIDAARGKPTSALKRALLNRGFLVLCLTATSLAIVILAILIIAITIKGIPWIIDTEAVKATFSGGEAGSWKHWIRWNFFTESPSRFPNRAGIAAPLIGSIWAVSVCALITIPVGVGSAIYLEEFAPRNRISRFIETNIRNLAGVPSIVYGILGLTAFARMFGLFGSNAPSIGDPESFFYIHLPFGQGVLSGGLTLMLVVLPIIIIASREAFRTVPNSLRQASLAMGATKWQTVWKVSLPAALPMIMTGSILSISRAIGEAAPLLVIGVPTYITSRPDNLMSTFTVLPLQIFDWAERPQVDFHGLAAAGIIVLLAVLLTFNAFAVFIRQRLHRQLA